MHLTINSNEGWNYSPLTISRVQNLHSGKLWEFKSCHHRFGDNNLERFWHLILAVWQNPDPPGCCGLAWVKLHLFLRFSSKIFVLCCSAILCVYTWNTNKTRLLTQWTKKNLPTFRKFIKSQVSSFLWISLGAFSGHINIKKMLLHLVQDAATSFRTRVSSTRAATRGTRTSCLTCRIRFERYSGTS